MKGDSYIDNDDFLDFKTYFTTGAGEKDPKKGGTWVSCIY